MGCCPSRTVTIPAEDQVPQQIVPQRQESAVSVDTTAADGGPTVGEVTVAGRPPTTTELDALRLLTEEQAAANAKAAQHIGEVAAAMEKMPEEEQEPAPYFAGGAYWDVAKGDLIEEALEHTPLIDLEYLVMLGRLGGVMPCGRQNVPPAAFITKRNLWRIKQWGKKRPQFSLGVLVLSYPWLDWFHPDRLGAQLRRLLPFFESMLAAAKRDSPHCTVGIMIDFLCLPQRPFASDEESAQFKLSLQNINTWYFHKFTSTLLVTTPPPEGAEYGNTRVHKQRGWCVFEQAASMARKPAHCVLDFSRYDGATYTHASRGLVCSACGCRRRRRKHPKGVGATDFGYYDMAIARRDPNSCVGQMMSGRQPPISPAVFGEQMRARVASGDLAFTAKADQEFVIDQYTTGFINAINSLAADENEFTNTLVFTGLGWGEAEFGILLEGLRYAAQHCTFPHGPVRVRLGSGNQACLRSGCANRSEWAELEGKFCYKWG